MKLRGYLVQLQLPTNTTTRSVGLFEVVRLEKNETREGAFLGRKFPKKTPTHLRGRFFFPFSAPWTMDLQRIIAKFGRSESIAMQLFKLIGYGPID